VKKLNPDFLNILCELNWDANLTGRLLVYQDRLEAYLLQLFARPETTE